MASPSKSERNGTTYVKKSTFQTLSNMVRDRYDK
jgi:hypothetical protein